MKLFLRRVSGNPSGSGVPEGNFFSEGSLETLRAVEFLKETSSPKGFRKPFGQWFANPANGKGSKEGVDLWVANDCL